MPSLRFLCHGPAAASAADPLYHAAAAVRDIDAQRIALKSDPQHVQLHAAVQALKQAVMEMPGAVAALPARLNKQQIEDLRVIQAKLNLLRDAVDAHISSYARKKSPLLPGLAVGPAVPHQLQAAHGTLDAAQQAMGALFDKLTPDQLNALINSLQPGHGQRLDAAEQMLSPQSQQQLAERNHGLQRSTGLDRPSGIGAAVKRAKDRFLQRNLSPLMQAKALSWQATRQRAPEKQQRALAQLDAAFAHLVKQGKQQEIAGALQTLLNGIHDLHPSPLRLQALDMVERNYAALTDDQRRLQVSAALAHAFSAAQKDAAAQPVRERMLDILLPHTAPLVQSLYRMRADKALQNATLEVVQEQLPRLAQCQRQASAQQEQAVLHRASIGKALASAYSDHMELSASFAAMCQQYVDEAQVRDAINRAAPSVTPLSLAAVPDVSHLVAAGVQEAQFQKFTRKAMMLEKNGIDVRLKWSGYDGIYEMGESVATEAIRAGIAAPRTWVVKIGPNQVGLMSQIIRGLMDVGDLLLNTAIMRPIIAKSHGEGSPEHAAPRHTPGVQSLPEMLQVLPTLAGTQRYDQAVDIYRTAKRAHAALVAKEKKLKVDFFQQGSRNNAPLTAAAVAEKEAEFKNLPARLRLIDNQRRCKSAEREARRAILQLLPASLLHKIAEAQFVTRGVADLDFANVEWANVGFYFPDHSDPETWVCVAFDKANTMQMGVRGQLRSADNLQAAKQRPREDNPRPPTATVQLSDYDPRGAVGMTTTNVGGIVRSGPSADLLESQIRAEVRMATEQHVHFAGHFDSIKSDKEKDALVDSLSGAIRGAVSRWLMPDFYCEHVAAQYPGKDTQGLVYRKVNPAELMDPDDYAATLMYRRDELKKIFPPEVIIRWAQRHPEQMAATYQQMLATVLDVTGRVIAPLSEAGLPAALPLPAAQASGRPALRRTQSL